jgi:hypothetical protein
MEIVVDPQEIALGVGLPLDRKLVVAQELPEYFPAH